MMKGIVIAIYALIQVWGIAAFVQNPKTCKVLTSLSYGTSALDYPILRSNGYGYGNSDHYHGKYQTRINPYGAYSDDYSYTESRGMNKFGAYSQDYNGGGYNHGRERRNHYGSHNYRDYNNAYGGYNGGYNNGMQPYYRNSYNRSYNQGYNYGRQPMRNSYGSYSNQDYNIGMYGRPPPRTSSYGSSSYNQDYNSYGNYGRPMRRNSYNGSYGSYHNQGYNNYGGYGGRYGTRDSYYGMNTRRYNGAYRALPQDGYSEWMNPMNPNRKWQTDTRDYTFDMD